MHQNPWAEASKPRPAETPIRQQRTIVASYITATVMTARPSVGTFVRDPARERIVSMQKEKVKKEQ
jgi:hypothetical protein